MDSKLLSVRLESLKLQSEITGKPQFLGFLSEEEAAFANKRFPQNPYLLLFGGYDCAKRVYAGLFPQNISPSNLAFPIKAITVSYRKQDTLCHRDFLGAVLALGIKREAIGDILIEDGRAIIFANNSVARLITEELNKVGRVGVKTELGMSCDLPLREKRENVSLTVSSLRLDCVIAAICSVSRGTAADIINEKRVSINSVPCEKATKTIEDGDKITIRGKGKFTIMNSDGVTKKGRIKLTVEKYL